MQQLRKENDLFEIEAEVDPYLESTEIHRRVIEQGGPALLFRNVKRSSYPVDQLVTERWKQYFPHSFS